jgi:hypothetical protein
MTDIALPALGESVVEATITKWFYKVGDFVKIDTPLFEVSTDKVDTEIPAPVTGTLAAIHAQEGETVPAGFIVASIEVGADKAAPETAPAPAPAPVASPQPELDTRSQLEVDTKSDALPAPVASTVAPLSTPPAPTVLSPVVRKLAERLDVDIAQVSASGPGGRVTRQDVEEAAQQSVKTVTPGSTSSTSTQVASTHVVSLTNEQLAPNSPGAPVAARAPEGSARSSLVHTLMYEVDVTGIENLSIPSRHAFLYSLVSALSREFPEERQVPLGVRSAIEGTYCSLYMKDASAWRPARLSQMVSELSATTRDALTPAMLTPTRFNVEVAPHAAIASFPPLFPTEAFVCSIAAPRAEVKAVNGGFGVRSVATVIVVFDPQLISYAQIDAVFKGALLATPTTAWADLLH